MDFQRTFEVTEKSSLRNLNPKSLKIIEVCVLLDKPIRVSKLLFYFEMNGKTISSI